MTIFQNINEIPDTSTTSDFYSKIQKFLRTHINEKIVHLEQKQTIKTKKRLQIQTKFNK
jgi:hypothetical protein